MVVLCWWCGDAVLLCVLEVVMVVVDGVAVADIVGVANVAAADVAAGVGAVVVVVNVDAAVAVAAALDIRLVAVLARRTLVSSPESSMPMAWRTRASSLMGRSASAMLPVSCELTASSTASLILSSASHRMKLYT